jgi:hypothetical protein
VEQCKRPQTFRLSRPRPSIDNRLRYSHCHVISGPALDKDPKGQPSEDHQSMDVSPKGLPASEGVGPAQNVNRSTDLGLRLVLPSFCMVTPRKEGSNLRQWYEEGADPHTLPAVIDSRIIISSASDLRLSPRQQSLDQPSRLLVPYRVIKGL